MANATMTASMVFVHNSASARWVDAEHTDRDPVDCLDG